MKSPLPTLPPELASRAPRRGRVLRVKRGYNPNSSSIGTIVFALPGELLGAVLAFGAVAGFVAGAFLRGEARRVGRAKPKRRSEKDAGGGEGSER